MLYPQYFSHFLNLLSQQGIQSGVLLFCFFFFLAHSPEASIQLFWNLLRIYITDLAGNKRGENASLLG